MRCLYLFLILIIIGLPVFVNAQEKEKQKSKTKSEEKKSVTRKALQQGIKFISTTPKDTIVNELSIDPYVEYTGRIIRSIYIERIGFEKSLYDSTKKVKKTITRVANALHRNSKEKTIRNHLFFKTHEPLIPAKLSDNERFLRDLDFILDSRIVVIPVEGTDSVDITVITRDVFSLGGSLGGSFPTAPKFSIYDANVSGRAQRIEYSMLVDPERSPAVGNALYYRKSSLFGSLANLEVGYTELNTNRSYGEENEFAVFTRLNRPLVSPYSRLAGGIELSRNWSENVFNDPDSIFAQYNYGILDTWIGFNMGADKRASNRHRQFWAVRYFDGNYQDQPEQPEFLEERKYNDVKGYLSEFTLYRQDYFKTRYVFGFGRTEDVPYGYSIGFTAGYITQLLMERPYAAIKFNYSFASKKGNFYRFLIQTGGFYRNEDMEDVVVQVGVAYFTRVWNLNRYKMRSYITTNYTSIYNRKSIDWLYINKKFMPGFSNYDLNAEDRTYVHFESILFTPWTLLGFRFGPFVSIDAIKVQCITCDKLDKTFIGISTGLRTRNENLIFGTMEVKATYIPSNEVGEPEFVFGFKQNLRVKNTGSFVRAPSLVLYN
ncbi:MAG: hypothetical protein MUC73_04300 [Cyclobacteriaceae bacterium]|nr:hypothetical protein [Cyclobacteriaceae bacterium]